MGRLVDAVRGHVAAVDDVLLGAQNPGGRLFVDVVAGVDVLLRRRTGDHLDDDVGSGFVTGLGLVIVMADPVVPADYRDLLAVTGLGIVRGDDLRRGPRNPSPRGWRGGLKWPGARPPWRVRA
jgi:hypothetical protein